MKNTWLFPVVQSLHLVGLAMLTGMIALSNYAVLRGRSSPPLPRWSSFGGLALITLTGLAMFAADASRYIANPAFWIKLALIALALALPRKTRPTAALSLTLWTGAVLASRLIEDFDK